MNPDAKLQADVAAELFWEPRVDAAEIAVSAKEGTVTLRREEAEATVRNGIQVEAVDGTVTLKGTVYSWEERNAAIDAACAAPGVIGVDDQLVVAG